MQSFIHYINSVITFFYNIILLFFIIILGYDEKNKTIYNYIKPFAHKNLNIDGKISF
jgi:hypothetical protein